MKLINSLMGAVIVTLGTSAGTALAGNSFCTTSGAYAVIPDSQSLHVTNMLTVECWFNRQILAITWNSLVSKESAGSGAFNGFDLRFLICPHLQMKGNRLRQQILIWNIQITGTLTTGTIFSFALNLNHPINKQNHPIGISPMGFFISPVPHFLKLSMFGLP